MILTVVRPVWVQVQLAFGAQLLSLHDVCQRLAQHHVLQAV